MSAATSRRCKSLVFGPDGMVERCVRFRNHKGKCRDSTGHAAPLVDSFIERKQKKSRKGKSKR